MAFTAKDLEAASAAAVKRGEGGSFEPIDARGLLAKVKVYRVGFPQRPSRTIVGVLHPGGMPVRK